jgi:uncharacterized SAM-binding protein YcdF (DUF218 family)
VRGEGRRRGLHAAEEDEAADAGRPRGFDEARGAEAVHAVVAIGWRARVVHLRREMHDGVDPGELPRRLGADLADLAAAGPYDRMATRLEKRDQRAADEPARSGDEDAHGCAIEQPMSFVVSKLGWLIVSPGNVLLFLLLLGLWRWRRLARAVAVLFVGIAVLPAGSWMTEPLEDRFPQVALPERVDGIVVLGGAFSLALSEKRGQTMLNENAERMTAAVALARRYEKAALLFTGGEPRVFAEGGTEAELARAFFLSLGVAEERLRFEDRSRNTFENALYSYDAARPKPGETWLLVTTAMHMPRSVGCFRKAGWDIVPYPVDYRTTGAGSFVPDFAFAEGLARINLAFREWLGLAAYWAMGRTDALLPAPR